MNPGWYDDPDSAASLRYWDGGNWTDDRQSKPPGVAATGSGVQSDKSFVGALLLCFFLGALGVHRFYVGKVGTGLLQLFTLGAFGIWVLIDFIMIAVGSFTDKQGRPIKN